MAPRTFHYSAPVCHTRPRFTAFCPRSVLDVPFRPVCLLHEFAYPWRYCLHFCHPRVHHSSKHEEEEGEKEEEEDDDDDDDRYEEEGNDEAAEGDGQEEGEEEDNEEVEKEDHDEYDGDGQGEDDEENNEEVEEEADEEETAVEEEKKKEEEAGGLLGIDPKLTWEMAQAVGYRLSHKRTLMDVRLLALAELRKTGVPETMMVRKQGCVCVRLTRVLFWTQYDTHVVFGNQAPTVACSISTLHWLFDGRMRVNLSPSTRCALYEVRAWSRLLLSIYACIQSRLVHCFCILPVTIFSSSPS